MHLGTGALDTISNAHRKAFDLHYFLLAASFSAWYLK